ncbi:ATPase [Curtobacterium sp. 'Ferrero']|uniref:sensor histidine kinase n=1 Tax=Curtobacterium sp. 'Ferrero' TaxID=2033654 RepID=UPI000BC3CAB4|nr:ATP-binding protein [Curtobacterium sp. 'Ferrero']PCN47218.1 ATPase [Curtobacterium sp. 'Ferrero']
MQASRSSTAARVFLVVTAGVVLVTALLAVLLVLDARRAAESGATDVTRAVATGLAADPRTVAALQEDRSRASRLLQPVATRAERTSGAAFVTIMTPDGVRVTHPDPAEVGRHYIGTVPDTPRVLTERTTGTLGPSVRTIVPVRDGDRLVGWVATGITVDRIGAQVGERLPFAIAVALAVFLLGVASAFLARRTTRRVLGDLPPGAVRDAVASVESVRTLGEALRSQQHEHANRVHTAVTLIELDRSDEAVTLLTEGARDAQHLVDHVRGGDPTVAALLLGKASQAGERHIGWQAEIEPDVPTPDVRPVDLVAVVGNLVDNALDAAADGSAPRWVRVAVRGQGADRSGGAGRVLEIGRDAGSDRSGGAGADRSGGAGRVLEIEVADSGAGIAPAHRSRVFERGWSTKSAADGGAVGTPQHAVPTARPTTAAPAVTAAPSSRGIGLALVRSVVDQAGGTVTVHHDPTRFVVRLPAGDTP